MYFRVGLISVTVVYYFIEIIDHSNTDQSYPEIHEIIDHSKTDQFNPEIHEIIDHSNTDQSNPEIHEIIDHKISNTDHIHVCFENQFHVFQGWIDQFYCGL
jgi:hypothetical protein